MKHIIALTTLAAAASAQTAPASGLNYNQIGVSRTSRQNAVTAQGLLGTSGFLVGLQSTSDQGTNNNQPSITLGYVFKGVTNGIDATVFVQQPQWEETVYGINLRRALNEVYAGLEVSIGYAGTLKADAGSYIAVGGTSVLGESALSYELSYNINKNFSVAVGQVHSSDSGEKRETVYSVRASF